MLAARLPEARVLTHPTGRAGRLAVTLVDGKSTITTADAGAPLKLLTPVSRGPAAWVYVGSYGGGLVAGDALTLSVTVGAGARAVLATQASTKIYRCPGDAWARQQLDADIGAGGLLVNVPDPIVAFAGARYAQRVRYDLAADAGVVALDWYTCGRMDCGERWAFHAFSSRTDVRVAGRPIAIEALSLLPPIAPKFGRFVVAGSLIVVGPPVAQLSALLSNAAGTPASRQAPWLASASPIAGGVIVRFAATATEIAQVQLSHWLRPLGDILGDDRWSRRW